MSLTGGLIIGGFYFMCYFSQNPDKIKKIATNISWFTVSSYHRLCLWYDFSFMKNECDDEYIKESTKIKFYGYDGDNLEKIWVEKDEIEGLAKDYEIGFISKIIKKKKYFKRLKNEETEENEENEENEEKLEKKLEKKLEDLSEKPCEEVVEEMEEEISVVPDYLSSLEMLKTMEKTDDFEISQRYFLQVELVMGEKKYDIHENIAKYYVVDNEIMDKLFMKYFMKHWYDVELEDDYTLNIIDKDISLLNLKDDVKIVINKNNYEVIN